MVQYVEEYVNTHSISILPGCQKDGSATLILHRCIHDGSKSTGYTGRYLVKEGKMIAEMFNFLPLE